MALITCPECGRENVSSSAVACPTCGYPISSISQKVESKEQITKISYLWIPDCKMIMTFQNGVENGCNGFALRGLRLANKNNLTKLEYKIENNSAIIGNMSLRKVGDYLLRDTDRFNGFIPNQEFFNAECSINIPDVAPNAKYSFFADGTYSYSDTYSKKNGKYLRKDDILCVFSLNNKSPHDKFPQCFVISDNALYKNAWIDKKRQSEVLPDENFVFLNELPDSMKEIAKTPTSTTLPNIMPPAPPKCPTCSSTIVEKISGADKALGAVVFGIFSKTAKSQFRCKNCGYKW